MNRNQPTVKILEAKIKQSNEEKKILEQSCSQLEGGNAELKSDDHEGGVKPDNCRDSILAMKKKENVSAKENKAVLNITTSNYDDWEEGNWCWLITERW